MDDIAIPTAAAMPAPDCGAIRRELEKTVIWQESAMEAIAHQATLFLNKKNPKKPLSIVAYGPPGTGKSDGEGAVQIPVQARPAAVRRCLDDLNTFAKAHSVYRLIGSPPGYVGYEDTPVFEAVTRNPHTVFVFDELDKAHPEVLKTLMSILDEGRYAVRKELPHHSREHGFKRCIFIFTSNYRLGEAPKKQICFGFPDVEEAQCADGVFEVSYAGDEPEAQDQIDVTRRVYRDAEASRKAFVETGVLAEIASRFNCFVEFKELSATAKVQILAMQVIEMGFEYNIRLAYISSSILQALVDAAAEDALTVRSFKAVIEVCLASPFAEAGERYGGQAIRLEGTIESPKLIAS
ncbi:MAG: AAA family ATPase [Clostridiales bacterium]|nr:AAA family ATPase [Clostridiales bacterium]